jgi:hypothetical protein
MLKGWKTLGLSIAVVVIGALDAFNWVEVIPDNVEPFIIPLLGLIFGYLRTITNTALGQSQ